MHRNRIGAVTGVLLIAVATLGAREDAERPQPAPGGPQEAEVSGVFVESQSGQPLLVLQGKRDRRTLVLSIGPLEAERIALPLQGVTPPRPLTHDLILNLLADLKASLRRIVITDLRDDVYYASLHLDAPAGPFRIDSRPSDAIALALRARVPILVEDRVFDKAERHKPRPGASPIF